MKSEIRKDYILDKYVLIAPKRGERPHDVERHEILNPSNEGCGFCPAKADSIKELLTLGPKKNWYVKVLPNAFPAVSKNNPKAYGTQEVVIETPNHLHKIEDLTLEHVVKVFEAYSHRTRDISKDKTIDFVLIFKNNGGKAGASVYHSHSQIFASSFLPPEMFEESQKAQAYRLEHGTCVYCDVIAKEKEGPRFIWEDENVVCFTPYASFYNYETWIMPKRHVDNITLVNDQERLSMAKILKHVLGKINELHLPYNYYFNQIVNDEDQHLCMKIVPRGNVWAGVELGSGLIINSVAPETAAKHFREGL